MVAGAVAIDELVQASEIHLQIIIIIEKSGLSVHIRPEDNMLGIIGRV